MAASPASSIDGKETTAIASFHPIAPATELPAGCTFHRSLECFRQRLGGNADLSIATLHHRGDFRRAALVEYQTHFRKGLHKLGDDASQGLSGLCMCRRDRQLAGVSIRILQTELFDIACVSRYSIDDCDKFIPWLGQAQQPLTSANKQFEPKLVLEILDVLAQTRLRREKRASRFCQIEPPLHGLANNSELLEIHCNSPMPIKLSKATAGDPALCIDTCEFRT
jgi:hypothetical protein